MNYLKSYAPRQNNIKCENSYNYVVVKSEHTLKFDILLWGGLGNEARLLSAR